MNDLTKKQMRELDAWINTNVLGWILVDDGLTGRPPGMSDFAYEEYGNRIAPRPTTDPADAMQVLEKCAEHGEWPQFTKLNHVEPLGYYVWTWEQENLQAETLPISICLFAKALFSNRLHG